MRTLFAAGAALITIGVVLGGCAMSLPVMGQSSDGFEHFSGDSVGSKAGGSVTLHSDRGRTCSGPFYYVSDTQGAGTLTCSDGQSGTFHFIASGIRGTGTGQVGGRMFTFTFG